MGSGFDGAFRAGIRITILYLILIGLFIAGMAVIFGHIIHY